MSKIKLIDNISLKLASLFIAVILWIIAINVGNPTITRTYSLTPEFLNTNILSENNFVMLNEKNILDTKIDVKVQATRNDLKFINKNSDNLKAVINFKDASKYTLGTPLSMDINIIFSSYLNSSRYQITNVYPSKIDVILDNLVTSIEQIYYETNGEPAKNYYIRDIDIKPQNITLSGAESIMKSIKPININLETANASKDIFIKKPIKIYDKNDNDITNNLSLEHKEVEIEIKIDSYKTINIEKPEVTGAVAEGYILKNIDYEPKKIEIIGENKSPIENLKLPTIDIENSSASKTVTYDLENILPEGVQIKKDNPNKIIVTIDIEKIDI